MRAGEASRLLPISSLTHRRAAPLPSNCWTNSACQHPRRRKSASTCVMRLPCSGFHRPRPMAGARCYTGPPPRAVAAGCLFQSRTIAGKSISLPCMVNLCRKISAISSLLPGRCELRRSMTRSRTPYPLGAIYRFAFPCSIRRHFEALDHFPDHLLPLGDVICRFNPAFGQGMSVAAQEAVALRRLIEARISDANPLQGLARPFFAAVQDLLAAPWTTAESDFVHEKTRGRRPNDFQQRLNFTSALLRVAAEDATVHQVMSEVSHLVKPSSALRDPQIVSRLAALMAASSSFRC